MKRLICIALIAAGVFALLTYGCSREGRDEAVNRMGKAAKALNGEVRPNDQEHATPNIVAEQQPQGAHPAEHEVDGRESGAASS